MIHDPKNTEGGGQPKQVHDFHHPPELIQVGLSIFGTPKNPDEDFKMKRGMAALEFSKNKELLKRIVRDEEKLRKPETPEDVDLKKQMEHLVGHEFTTVKRFFRDIKSSVIDGSEQRWKVYNFDQPFANELEQLDERLVEAIVGGKPEDVELRRVDFQGEISCKRSGERKISFGHVYRMHRGVAVNKDPLNPDELDEEIARGKNFARKVNAEISGGDLHGLESANMILIKEMLIGKSPATIDDPGETVGGPSALKRLKLDGIRLEHAILWTSERAGKEFRDMDNPAFARLAIDVETSGNFALEMLSGKNTEKMTEEVLSSVKPHTIIYVDTLDPKSVKILAENDNIKGVIVTDEMALRTHIGKTFADYEKIAVAITPDQFDQTRTGDPIVIDTFSQNPKIHISPSQNSLKQLLERKNHSDEARQHMKDSAIENCTTEDGVEITLLGNTESVFGFGRVATWGADGVKLLRTELMFAREDELPGEDRQTHEYVNAKTEFKTHSPKGIIGKFNARFIDVGRDKEGYPWLKKIRQTDDTTEGLNFLLNNPDILRTQARAFYRAGLDEATIPMVTDLDSLQRTLKIIESSKEEVREKMGEDSRKLEKPNFDMKIGIMVETPTAAMSLNSLTPEVDFQTIGTNDLAHFMLGKPQREDRPEKDPFTPLIFHRIYRIIEHGVEKDIPTGVCGDMAADEVGSLALVGMYELAKRRKNKKTIVKPEFGMSSIHVPSRKRALQKANAGELADIVEHALQGSDPQSQNSNLTSAEQLVNFLSVKFGVAESDGLN